MFKQCLFKYWGSSISHVDKNVIRYTIFSLFIGWWTFGLFFCGFEIVNSTALNREYWYLFETVVSFTLNAYLEVELLDHMVVLFLFFWGISKYLFSWWLCRFAFPTTLVVKWLPANAGGPQIWFLVWEESRGSFFSTFSPVFISYLLMMAILIAVRYYLHVILICIPFMTGLLEHLLCACGPFVRHLWRGVSSNPLPII